MLHASRNSHRLFEVNTLTETDQFKARPVYLLPILASLLTGLVFSYVLLSSNIGTLPVTPFPETPSGQFSNALYFVILIAIAATIFYLLIKWKSRKMISVLIGFAMTAASVLLSAFYSTALLSSLPNWEIYVVIISIAVTIVFDYAVFTKAPPAPTVAVPLAAPPRKMPTADMQAAFRSTVNRVAGRS